MPYSDLSDFFFVWLKRTLLSVPGADSAVSLTPKVGECIVDKVRGKGRTYYESTMSAATREGRRVLSPTGIGLVVFAHKSTGGWEAQLRAMVEAGWTITGSWPIDTEMGTRLRAMDSAALASSVHLICRPRENADGSVKAGDIGDWREVLDELPKRIHVWLPTLMAEGVVGADAIFACLGPALEVYSRYSRVEKASGEQVGLGEYLEHVWAAVAREALSLLLSNADAGGLEPDARLTAMWLWTLSSGRTNGERGAGEHEADEDEEDDDETGGRKTMGSGYALEFDAARKIAQGLGANLDKLTNVVEVKGDTARLLTAAERTRYLFGKDGAQAVASTRKPKAALQFSMFEELAEAEKGATGVSGAPPPGSTALDRVHQAMILFGAGRSEALKRFLVEDGVGRDNGFCSLAQSLSALYPTGSQEKRWVDGVLARKKGLGF